MSVINVSLHSTANTCLNYTIFLAVVTLQNPHNFQNYLKSH
ncbi:hypothetical protein SAMN02745220_00957 [Desulfopila aestuarii DSM 18488]|uniref:Uncharacterized protein n=1 Tax=Desulfopila aestuarii DSM 18488 TaxID=1121416 RepID=A0A1M7Y081_9BACT|nr:hypothetical protein SAMN02745220_00957 [Desulfopila aestuarii DSM 18488]